MISSASSAACGSTPACSMGLSGGVLRLSDGERVAQFHANAPRAQTANDFGVMAPECVFADASDFCGLGERDHALQLKAGGNLFRWMA